MERYFLKRGGRSVQCGIFSAGYFHCGANWGVTFCLWGELGSDVLSGDHLGSDVLSGAFWGLTFCPGHFGE
uniref:Uncharacterized protein n=1 Tax=Meloidogyne enterolobii TaxID=390850 RepID=A0A6V7YAG6_MELEN|nr:unnamed protein product [Meloidogyne enterolobii]